MRVAIIHPWFPQYRVEFFERLVQRAAEEGVAVSIFHGDSPPEWKDRNDAEFSDAFTRLPTKFFKVRGRTLNRKSLRGFNAAGKFDLVILEQAVRNLESYTLHFRRLPIAYWGHGKTYTLDIGAGQERLKHWLTSKGRWFFAYTAGGADAVVTAGYPRNRTTVVQNSIDSSALRDGIDAVTEERLADFSSSHDLRGKTALFIGGLDPSKRLNMLMDAAELAHDLDADFRLLIAGAGVDGALVERRARDAGYISCLGSLFGADKALAIRASQVMAMPGRVGLIAVDSFAGSTPIVTTQWAWHAPEFEYLESGVNAVITADDPASFAAGLISTLKDGPALAVLRAACRVASERYTVEAMVENFLDGMQGALAVHK
jgi:glycosyltransferase involved in cell wall biosynthesis